jgi:NADP-dependent 3-hydroxy acid dehydrogenase YdfG
MAANTFVKRALVTGASSGIGAATVEALIADGWAVIAMARRADRLTELSERTGCDVFVGDVTSDDDVARLVEKVRSVGGIQVLVNNAGLALGVDHVAVASSEDWATMFEVNVLGTQRMIKAMLPILREQSLVRGVADIVTVTSTAAFVSYEGGGGYNAAKAGLHAMLQALRLELSGEPLRVIEIAPGMVKTEEFTLKRMGGDHERVSSLYEGVEAPLVAADIAEMIRYAISLPNHVNLDVVQIKPVAQAVQYKLHRGPLKPKI